MIRIRRLIVVMLLAVFAAGTVAHSAMATEMAVTMAVADAGEIGMDMPDCSGCDTDDATDMAACDLACTAPLVADLSSASLPGPHIRPQHEPSIPRDMRGRTGGPALDPPRTLI